MTTQLAGIGKKERFQLSQLLKAGMSVITPKTAANILKIDQIRAAQLLALWSKKGWLARVKHGVYIPVPLQSESTEIMVDEPWKVVKALFSPGYIGGWSAAEYWDLTEQIFNSTMVFTTKKSASRKPELKGLSLVIKTIKSERIFGTQSVWRDDQKIEISDPTRTIIDAFNDPTVVGGIRMAGTILDRYLKSEHKNITRLLEYGKKMKNATLFKRLGFMLEQIAPEESVFIEKIKDELSEGYSQLDPASPGKSLITKWHLWVPSTWKNGINLA